MTHLEIHFSSINLLLGREFTLADYPDGYTSQYSKHNDVYFYLNFVVIYKINNNIAENVLSRR